MKSQFLSIGKKVDELSYFKSLLDSLRAKSTETPYSERIAFQLNDVNEAHLETQFQHALEEVSVKEKDFSQLFQMTEFLFEKHDELNQRVTELTALNQNYSTMEQDLHQRQAATAEDL